MTADCDLMTDEECDRLILTVGRRLGAKGDSPGEHIIRFGRALIRAAMRMENKACARAVHRLAKMNSAFEDAIRSRWSEEGA